METIEAFKMLMHDKQFYKDLPQSKKSTFRTYRKRLTDGALLSTEKMESILEAYGFEVCQPKLWVKK